MLFNNGDFDLMNIIDYEHHELAADDFYFGRGSVEGVLDLGDIDTYPIIRGSIRP